MAEFEVVVNTDILRAIIQQLPQKQEDFIAAVANEMQADMVESMGTSPPGITYKRGNVEHVASQPGYPPNPDEAALRDSITVSDGDHDLEKIIHDQVAHGVFQEFGTEVVEARPWMIPVFESWQRGKFEDAARNFKMVP